MARLTYEELQSKLNEAEDIIGALRSHEVDAVVSEKDIAFLRLREVEEAVQRARQELEERVVERTAELARVNRELRETLEEQRQTQLQLQQQAELLDLAHDMIFVHDMSGRIVFWNHGAEQSYGWTRDEAVGQFSHHLLRTEYSEPLIRITARIIRDGHWEGELTHTARDGRRIVVGSRWALRRGPDGLPAAILEIDSDITDRKQAERKMAEARYFAESIVDTIQECLVVLDPQLRIISANRAFHETFRTTDETVVGRLFDTLDNSPWGIPELRRKLLGVLPQNTSFENFEVDCDLPGIGRKTCTLSARPVRGQAPGHEMILLVIQDVTMSKRQADEIRADKEQLSALTEELLVTEERQRQRIATALHDSISQVLAFSKRELMQLGKQAPEAMRDSLKQVCRQIGSAISQTRDLMLELAPSTLQSLGLAAAVEELAEQFCNCEGFACRVQTGEEPAPVTDEVKSLLYRAVRELLVNAAKHSEARNVSVAIDSGPAGVKVVVQDDGKGFEPDELKSICNRDRGFGIFSLQQRLKHIGGRLIIDSARGRGTKVTILAPLDNG